jgi:hypothetical protein
VSVCLSKAVQFAWPDFPTGFWLVLPNTIKKAPSSESAFYHSNLSAGMLLIIEPTQLI